MLRNCRQSNNKYCSALMTTCRWKRLFFKLCLLNSISSTMFVENDKTIMHVSMFNSIQPDFLFNFNQLKKCLAWLYELRESAFFTSLITYGLKGAVSHFTHILFLYFLAILRISCRFSLIKAHQLHYFYLLLYSRDNRCAAKSL